MRDEKKNCVSIKENAAKRNMHMHTLRSAYDHILHKIISFSLIV